MAGSSTSTSLHYSYSRESEKNLYSGDLSKRGPNEITNKIGSQGVLSAKRSKHNTSAIQDTVYYLISWAWSDCNSTTNVARAVSQTGFQPPIPNAHSSL